LHQNILEKNMTIIAKALGTLGLVGCAVIISPYAAADDADWYIGGNIGQSRAKIDDARITSDLLGGGFTTTSISDNNHDTGFKFFEGYKLNKNFALEGGYFNLGQFGFTSTASTTALPKSPGTVNGNIKIVGLYLDAVGILPITEKFSVFGRAGLNYAVTRDNFTSTGAVTLLTNPTPSKNGMNPKAGLGLQYDFTDSLGMRVEAERYRINDAVGNTGDIDLVSLGLVYRFGVKKPAPTPAPKAAAPEPVVAAIAPEPVVVPPPPPPAPKKTTFSADSSAGSLFDFGKATLKPEGQDALNKFAADLKDASFDSITVTGHTDRIGSKAYNMKLSARRAEAVKAYLVKSSGIPSDKITAKGVDGSEPVTKPGECTSKNSKKLIACLAPDRRVIVEVTATRTSK
jgi:OOP family OmpA-OmpF porin